MQYFLICFSVFCLFMLVRNFFVFHERIRMIEMVFKQEDWFYYATLKNGVSYEYMLYHFWVWPISKMWPQELRDLK